jgi:hypothetical protein
MRFKTPGDVIGAADHNGPDIMTYIRMRSAMREGSPIAVDLGAVAHVSRRGLAMVSRFRIVVGTYSDCRMQKV